MKYGEMNWKILWQEFYDDVTSDITYEFLIQWVSDHQVKERRCKKEEIRKAYIEYLKMIYKYNLSDASWREDKEENAMEKYSFITQEELRSLLYYQGAVEKIQLNSSELELRKFYSINNAYETINMLLFPGIENEKSR